MELVKPGIGLVFWMVVSFSIVLFILGKFAWKIIINAIHDREISIVNALHSAEKAKEEMAKLVANNEKILEEARQEKNAIIQEGKELKEKILAEAKAAASKEAEKLMQNTRKEIDSQKDAAINDMKKQITILSVEIAEKILQQKLSDSKEQSTYVDKLIQDLKI